MGGCAITGVVASPSPWTKKRKERRLGVNPGVFGEKSTRGRERVATGENCVGYRGRRPLGAGKNKLSIQELHEPLTVHGGT